MMKKPGKHCIVISSTNSRTVISAAILASLICSTPASATPASTTKDESSWEQLQKAGTEATDTGRYGVAERTLKQAVIKSAVFGEGDIRYAKSLDELGRLLTIRGRFAEAEPLLEEAQHARELTMDQPSSQFIKSLGALVSFHLEHGTVSKAEPRAKQLLAIIEGQLDEYRTASQGPVTLKKGQPLSGWAGTASLAMRDPVIDWAITCDAIGNQFRTRGQLEMADRLFKAALDVKETVLGKEHLSLANSFESIGTICQEKNEDTEAESFFKYALEHTERIVPDEHTQVYSRLDRLAKCLIKEQKYEEAEKLYLRALELWKKEPSKNGSEARTMFALGNLSVIEKKYDEAAPILQNALKLAEEFYGPDSASLLPYLQRCADVMYYLGQDDLRKQLKARADTINGVATEEKISGQSQPRM